MSDKVAVRVVRASRAAARPSPRSLALVSVDNFRALCESLKKAFTLLSRTDTAIGNAPVPNCFHFNAQDAQATSSPRPYFQNESGTYGTSFEYAAAAATEPKMKLVWCNPKPVVMIVR